MRNVESADAKRVDDAANRLRGIVTLTPLERNSRLTAALDCTVWLKREDLQTVRSYKVRGAYNLIAQLDAAERSTGVVAASAGNHAQGVAFACAELGVHGRVYVPSRTPRQKRDRIAALGGRFVEVVVGGETYDDAATAAANDARNSGTTLVPAFDDPRTIEGQGTVVREAVEQLGHAPDLVVLPVGGGGLLAGSLTWLTANCPDTRVVGVEPAGAACVAASIANGGPVTLSDIDTFVDGAAVRRVGTLTYPIIAGSGVELVTVSEGAVCSEMLALYQSDGIIAEPAGALACAALTTPEVAVRSHSTVVCVLSGGNNDVSRYAEIIERSLIHEGRKHYFLVEFPQEPGALRNFLDEVLGPGQDITLFDYIKRNSRETGPALVGIELAHASDLQDLLMRMKDSPVKVEQVSPGSPLSHFLM